MVTWNNLDKLASFEELKKVERVNLAAKTEQSA